MTRILIVAAAVCLASAQPPVVGEIDFYGLHKITPEQILNALHVKTGNPLPPSKGDLEDALERLPGVVQGRVEAVCCEGPRASLFIGIEERGAPHAAFHSDPTGDATLPEDLRNAYQQFVTAVGRAAVKGETAEDLSAGHPIMSDPVARSFPPQFIDFATHHLDQLREVLKNSSEADQRAAAAAIINYAPNKKEVAGDLQYALQDPDESVRANAIRSLNAIAVLAARQPNLGIKISPTWFIELLNSIVLSDRLESAKALLTLTDRQDPSVLAQIREQAVAPLAEMARWKTPRYALPAFLVLGRVAGMTDDRIQQAWATGARAAVIEKASETAARKK